MVEDELINNKIFALQPQAVLKKDKGRSIIFKLGETMTIESYQFVHPTIAVMLSLFDGEKPFQKVVEVLSFVAKVSGEVARNELIKLVDGKLTEGKKWLVEVNKDNKRLFKRKYNPLHFVDIPAKHIADPRMATPASLNYILTYRCPARCIYCYSEAGALPPLKEMPMGRIRELIEEARALGVVEIYLGGGDPFHHPNFFEILPLVIESGIIVFVSTKTLLSETQMDKLRDCGLERIQISIDTLDANTAKFLTGVDDYPLRMTRVITKLINHGLMVSTNTVVTPYNLKDVPNLVEYLVSLGVYRIGIAPYSRSLYRHKDSLFLKMEDYEWLSEQARLMQNKYPHVKINFQDARELCNPTLLNINRRRELWARRSICSVGRQGLVIWPDGKVGICEEIPHKPEYWIGDLMRNSMLEIWNAQKMEEILLPSREIFRGTPCYDCEEFEACNRIVGRCFRDSLKVYGTIYAPPPLCPRAPATMKRLC